MAIPNELKSHNDETTRMGDKDARLSHHCYNYDCQQIVFCSWNGITYLPKPSKPYDLEGEIKTKDLEKYSLENADLFKLGTYSRL